MRNLPARSSAINHSWPGRGYPLDGAPRPLDGGPAAGVRESALIWSARIPARPPRRPLSSFLGVSLPQRTHLQPVAARTEALRRSGPSPPLRFQTRHPGRPAITIGRNTPLAPFGESPLSGPFPPQIGPESAILRAIRAALSLPIALPSALPSQPPGSHNTPPEKGQSTIPGGQGGPCISDMVSESLSGGAVALLAEDADEPNGLYSFKVQIYGTALACAGPAYLLCVALIAKRRPGTQSPRRLPSCPPVPHTPDPPPATLHPCARGKGRARVTKTTRLLRLLDVVPAAAAAE